MPRYINDDQLPIRARKIMKKLSKKEFWDLMFDFAKNHDSYNEISSNYNIYDDNGGYTILSIILSKCESVNLDKNTINIDSENMTCDKNLTFGDDIVGTPMLGLQSINDEFSFFGFELGGDWEYPAFGIIYYDGDDFRVYYPHCGNPINLDFKCAFGSEFIDWTNPIQVQKYAKIYSKVFAANPKRGIFYTDVLEDEEGLMDLYKMKYDMDIDDSTFGFNWDLIKEDILKMFVLR